MNYLKTLHVAVLILLVSSLLYGAEEKNSLIVTHASTRVYSQPSAFTTQTKMLNYGSVVDVLATKGNWVEIFHPKTNTKGFVYFGALLDEKAYKRQGKYDGKEYLKASGFSESSSLTAGVKGFSEEDAVSVASKGFNSEVEDEYKKQNPNSKFNYVDMFDRKKVKNLQSTYKYWRQQGQLGEFGPYYQKPSQ